MGNKEKRNSDKDWLGNHKTVFTTIGASSHSEGEREVNDYYATDPIAAELLLKLEKFTGPILEPACGEGHLSEVLNKVYKTESYDLINRGYGTTYDFFNIDKWEGDIITNPPYSIAEAFVRHSLNIIPNGYKVCMFLRTLFVEGQKRAKLFEEYPPVRVWVASKRINCAKNGDFKNYPSNGAVSYSWFVWEKGHTGITELKWFN